MFVQVFIVLIILLSVFTDRIKYLLLSILRHLYRICRNVKELYTSRGKTREMVLIGFVFWQLINTVDELCLACNKLTF